MERELRYDVVVAGGGSAGVAAAVGARRAGAGTLLLERSPYLGGQATHSLVPAYCGFCTNGENWTQVVKGVGQLVLDRLADMGRFDGFYTSPTGNLIARVDPEAAKLALDQLVEEEKVDCLLYAQVIRARSQGGKVLSLECVDDAGRFFVTADAFVDATGDANLAYLAGAPVEFHCDQTGSMMFRLGGVEPGADLSPDAMQSAITAARDAGVEGFSATRGTAVPVPGCDDFLVNLISLKMPDIDARTLTAVEREGRRQARLYLETFKQRIPGLEHAFLVQTGPRAGFRESRRIIGEYTLTREDVKTSRKDPAGIARGGLGGGDPCGQRRPRLHSGAGGQMVRYPHRRPAAPGVPKPLVRRADHLLRPHRIGLHPGDGHRLRHRPRRRGCRRPLRREGGLRHRGHPGGTDTPRRLAIDCF